MSPTRMRALVAGAACAAVTAFPVVVSSAAGVCPAPAPMVFAPPTIVDTQRAGGEPMIHVHPDGTLIYGSHAGTTHAYAPAATDSSSALTQHYNGQTYFWWSADHGRTWTFAPRPGPENQDYSGFSDPDVAIDGAGNVYISEINALNVAVSRSTDRGRSYELRNLFAEAMADRQWSEADANGIVYLTGNVFGGGTSSRPAGDVGHMLYRSTDGGATFAPGVRDEERGWGTGDLRIDRRNGTLYETHYEDLPLAANYQEITVAAFRGARTGDMSVQTHRIATGAIMNAFWPSLDVDANGNLYVAWSETGAGTSGRAGGIWYAYSRTGGRTWSAPVRVDRDGRTDIWPWIAAGDDGRVAIAWLQADVALPNSNAQTAGAHGWKVVAASTLNGLGCATSKAPGFAVAEATIQPIHRGTICRNGTSCQLTATDRRLGDYFTIDIDATGRMVAAFGDTTSGGAVALPAFLRQTGGPLLVAPKAAVSPPRPRVGGVRRELPATGVDDSAILLGLVLAAASLALAGRLRGGVGE